MGRQMALSTKSLLSFALLMMSMLVAGAIPVIARRTSRLGEGEASRSRHSSQLVLVEPISTRPGRPVVDVMEIETLVKLAERYGLLILCWTRSGVETFVVQDESTTYRYRATTSTSSPVERVVADA